jgi:hypothetical protein
LSPERTLRHSSKSLFKFLAKSVSKSLYPSLDTRYHKNKEPR